MKYQEGNEEKKEKKFFESNSRSLTLIINAAVVLVIVIIAMAVQLRHLDKRDKGEKTIESRAAATETPAVEPEATPEPTPEIERIRKDLDKDKPMVALTFDDGPYDKVTNRLVKTLAKHDSRATFFAVGNRIDRYADAVKNAYEHGNQIATHTYDHRDLTTLTRSGIKKELKKSSNTTKKVIGQGPAMLRPPYGDVNDTMRKTVNMPMINWDVDTEDWKSKSKKEILKRCKVIEDGDIVLMHDLYSTTADAVEILVPRMRKKGFQFVTVEELFYYKGIDAEKGKVYYSGK